MKVPALFLFLFKLTVTCFIGFPTNWVERAENAERMGKMKRILPVLAAGLLCLLLGIGAGTVAVQPSLELTIPPREYRACQLEEKITRNVSLRPGCADYEVVSNLQPLMVEEMNRQFQDSLSRKATLADIQAGEYYRIYITNENLYGLRTADQLLETLQQGDAGWDCYITIEDDCILVKLRTMSLTQDGESVDKSRYWTIHSMEKVGDSQPQIGYDAAIQTGLQHTPDATQAFLVRNSYGFQVCLLCSDTIDTLVTVGETSLYGTAPFFDAVVSPGAELEEGVFSFPALAARSTSFQPTLAFLPIELKQRMGLWGNTVPHITQRQSFTGLQTVLLTAGLLAAMGAALAVWQKRTKRSGGTRKE